MKKNPRNSHVSAWTDKETFDFFRKISEKENQSISNVFHLALKKAKANFKPNEITREI